MATSQSGSQLISTPYTDITFAEAMSSSAYTVMFRCYDPTTLEGIGCDIAPANYQTTGFRAAPIADSVRLEWAAFLIGSPVVLPQSRLSRDYTALKLWIQANRDLNTGIELPSFERFDLINRACRLAANLLYPILEVNYLTTLNISAPSDDVSVLGLQMAMGASQHRIQFLSSLTDWVHPVSPEKLAVFQASAAQNRSRIVWALKGDTVYFKHGSGLASLGTVTATYPRVPVLITADTDYVDIPDGAAMEVAIAVLRKMVATRAKVPEVGVDVAGSIKAMYDSLGLEMSLETIKQKVAEVL